MQIAMLMTDSIAKEERANNLSEAALKSPLSEISGIEALKIRKTYRRGAVLFVEGQPAHGLYVLCEGRAKVSIVSADGKSLTFRLARPGELLGINATLRGAPYGATVQTLERCRIDFIPREELLQLLDRDKSAYLGVAQVLSHMLSSVVDHSRLLFLSQSVSEKLARLLVKWCDEHGEWTPEGTRISSGLTHEEMAQMICTSRETVTRLFTQMKRSRIISFSDNAIFVRNRTALELLARAN